ncbi:hypothetical protein AOCH_002652, partial [Aspergillus ochraceoroseus]
CEWGVPVKRGKADAAARYLQPPGSRWPATEAPWAAAGPSGSDGAPIIQAHCFGRILALPPNATLNLSKTSPIPVEAFSPTDWSSVPVASLDSFAALRIEVLPILPVLFRRVLLYESLDPELFQIKDVNNVLLCIAALQFGAAVFGANNMTLRYKTWRALIDDLVQTRHQAAALLAEIMGCSRASTRRTLNTINMAVSTFYAQALFHHRLLYPPCPPSTLHRLAVTNIVEIARKQHMSDPRLLRRLHWPLLMAVIEIENAVQPGKMSIQDAWEACDKIDTLFILVCSVFCWLIIPAVGLAYSGYSTRFNSLASFYPGLLAVAVCSVQWWMVGYSLAYSDGNPFIGDLSKAFHIGVLSEPVGTIPEILFSEFQLIFCATVCAIAIGGASPPPPFFCLAANNTLRQLWSTFIYAPLAHMVWSGNGFLAQLGALDFAGGTPVHICSGATATAMSIYLSYPLFRSRRSTKRTPQHLRLHKPHNSICQLLALMIIWNAWLAFDAGTTLSLNFKSIMAACVTNLCAASGALTWAGITYWETGKFSLDSTFLGAIAGLVLITPSAGFIDLNTSIALGVVGALAGRQALRIKFTKAAALWRWVDNGDTFATHCLGGLLGTLATGLFAQKAVAAYDGVTEIPGGCFFDGNWRQLGVQLVEALVGFTWSFVGSYVLYALVDCVPGLEVLATDEDIIAGMDASQMDESLHQAQWAGEEDYHPFHAEIQI